MKHERLKELIHYDPDSGEFTWLVKRGRSAIVGSVAGTINSRGYRQIYIDSKPYLAHRLAWLYMHGCWPDNEIDHINLNRCDNRLCNLRLATRSQNCQNRKLPSHNTSGVLGVHWHSEANKWEAKIFKHRKCIYLGLFEDLELAELVAAEARAKHFGEFAIENSTAGVE
jgi:hypothetical protein